MITLYIKTHCKTGLKYFGKTSKDPFNYKGSGLYWNRHLKKYGSDVITTVLKQFDENDPKLKEYALEFSRIYNITNSNKWANLMPENGRTGGDCRTGMTHTEESKQLMRDNTDHSGENNPNFGKTGSKSSFGGHKHNQKSKDLMSRKQKGKIISQEQRDLQLKTITAHFLSPAGEKTRQQMRDNHAPCSGKNNSQYGKTREKSANWGKTVINNTKNSKVVSDDILIHYLIDGWVIGILGKYCTYCDKFIDPRNFGRWHGDKCKMKL